MYPFGAPSRGAPLVVVLVCWCISLAACSAGSDEPGHPPPASDPLKQAIATATLSSLSASSSAEPVSATATFAATSSGVDLTVVLRGCAGAAEKPIRILEARNCSGVGAESAIWGGERGRGIPGVLCTSGSSGEGMLRYSRRAALPAHWMIGGGSIHDLVGHAIALFDPATDMPTACGVIERGEDRTLVALPAGNEAPSTDARAQLAGLCVARLTAGAASGACADAGAITACAAEHCELGACVERCTDFTACVDAGPDPCTTTCEASAECAECQAAVTSCALGFCGAHMLCPAIPKPDGACSQLMACCTLQGEGAGGCLEVARLIANVAGETSCISALADWDVVSHMHVPCNTETAWNEADPTAPSKQPLQGEPCTTQADCGDGLCVGAARSPLLMSPGRCQPRVATQKLGDHVVGAACTSDDACGGGQCASRTALLNSYPEGYCSGRCYEDATCGAGAVCLLPLGASDPGHCLQACESDADCPRDHYRCTPLGDSVRVLKACYPRGDALPDHVVGQACESNADCASAAASCWQGMPLSALPPDQIVPALGGYCSAPCLFDVDCGAGAQCISGGIAGGQCMSNCDAQRPCREGYSCIEHLRDADPEARVCMPDWD